MDIYGVLILFAALIALAGWQAWLDRAGDIVGYRLPDIEHPSYTPGAEAVLYEPAYTGWSGWWGNLDEIPRHDPGSHAKPYDETVDARRAVHPTPGRRVAGY